MEQVFFHISTRLQCYMTRMVGQNEWPTYLTVGRASALPAHYVPWTLDMIIPPLFKFRLYSRFAQLKLNRMFTEREFFNRS